LFAIPQGKIGMAQLAGGDGQLRIIASSHRQEMAQCEPSGKEEPLDPYSRRG
jgi:hypothetical protein